MAIFRCHVCTCCFMFFFFQAEDGIRDYKVTGVQTCALPISSGFFRSWATVLRISLLNALACRSRAHCAESRRLASSRSPVRRVSIMRCSFHRSEEHTSELQSPCNLVCRLLLEKKKKNNKHHLIGNAEHFTRGPSCSHLQLYTVRLDFHQLAQSEHYVFDDIVDKRRASCSESQY